MRFDDTSDTRGALCRKSPMRARMERFMQTGVLASLVSPTASRRLLVTVSRTIENGQQTVNER